MRRLLVPTRSSNIARCSRRAIRRVDRRLVRCCGVVDLRDPLFGYLRNDRGLQHAVVGLLMKPPQPFGAPDQALSHIARHGPISISMQCMEPYVALVQRAQALAAVLGDQAR
jgi:hypothetical protein